MLSLLAYWFEKLVQAVRDNIRAVRDNTSATNANTLRVVEQTSATEKNNQLLTDLAPLLQKIVESLNPEAVSFGIELTDIDGADPVQGASPMAVQLPDTTGPKLLTLTPRDAKGFPTTLDGTAEFKSSDESVATVASQSDLVGRIDFVDTTPGKTVQIQFSGDARKGDEVVPVSGVLDLEFIAGEAATLEGALTDAT